jgi:lauroyl/myristoyl acyltransferase
MRTYVLFRLAGLLAPLLPRRAGYALMGLAARLMYRLNRGHRVMIQANVRRVLGEDASDEAVGRVARRIFHNLLKNYFDLFWLPAQPAEKIARLVTVHGMENADDALDKGKGIIAVSVHIGNQEVMTQVRSITDRKLTVIGEHLKPERVFRYVMALRQPSGIRIIPQDGALREIIQSLKRNEIIGLVFDRDATDSGRVIDFLGSPAKLPDGYALLALKYGAPIVPAFILRQPDDTYAARIEKPMFFEGRPTSDEDVRHVMDSVAAVAERYIRTYLDQWVYFHYVWEEDKERTQREQKKPQS